MSMDSNGKIVFAKHSEISQANLKNLAGMRGEVGSRRREMEKKRKLEKEGEGCRRRGVN